MSMIDQTRTLAQSMALAMGLGIAMLTGATAQDATTPPAPASTDAPANAPAATGGPELSMGTEVNPGAGGIATPETATLGQTYLQAPFDLWEQRCVRTEDGSDPCQLYQLLRDQTGNAVAEISLFDLPAGTEAAAGATIVVPLETLLTADMLIAIDGGKAKVYPFTFCAPIGCISRIGFTGPEVEQFKKGAGAVMTIVPAVAPAEKVILNISLKGFTAGFKAVTEANADLPAQ